jgi:hypothetical protein
MTNVKQFISLFVILLISISNLDAQMHTVSGYVKDFRTDETLIGVNIYDKNNPNQGASTNNYGFFSLSIKEGKYTLSVSYIGYEKKEVEINLDKDLQMNISLSEGIAMKEVVIKSKVEDKNVQSTEMGTIALPVEDVKKLPALMGEVDVLKALQLLPGVKAREGSSGFYVRGGGPDQNLVLLDEALVYNPGHLLGFFSVFNADAIKNLTLIKGGMPANYGGRLSSVVDIQMKEGNNKEYGVEGGIGLISSRLLVEGPIVKEKSSFMVSMRRTYALDIAQPFVDKTKFKGSNYYFYDFNGKVNYKFSDKDRLYLSGYFGRDVFAFNSNERGFKFDLPYGNATGTLRWNHVFNQKLFMNVSGIYNDYDFKISGGQDVFKFQLISGVRDWNGKIDLDYFPNTKHTLKMGTNYTYHRLTPSIVTAAVGDISFSNNALPKNAHELAVYISDDYRIDTTWSLNLGLRGAYFNLLGPYTSNSGKVYASGESVASYPAIEPRISGKFSVDKNTSLKGSISYTTQFLHLVSNSASTLPTDVWVPSSDVTQPQRSVQYALGFFKNFLNNDYETSLEVYYRDLNHQIDYPENYVQRGNSPEQSFVYGVGRAYGAELFVKKSRGKLTGWIGYTLSRTERSFDEIENGKWYAATYDRTHDLSVVANYRISKKWELGGSFVYSTGNTFTPLKSLFFIEQKINTQYAERNSVRYEPYNRFDIAATFTPHPESTKKFQGSWTFAIYNTYNQLNPFFIYYDIKNNFEQGNLKATAYKVTLFPLIPSITYNFKWRQKRKE